MGREKVLHVIAVFLVEFEDAGIDDVLRHFEVGLGGFRFWMGFCKEERCCVSLIVSVIMLFGKMLLF